MALPSRSTISSYDGQNKVNSVGIPPAVQSTDWNNPLLAACTSDVAGMVQTAPRFWCRVVLAATTGGMSISNWEANWINATSTAPVPAHSSTGVFTITLPTTVSDEYDASVGLTNNVSVNLIAASGSLEGSTAGFINCSASANVITINTFNSGGSANNMAGTTAFVIAY